MREGPRATAASTYALTEGIETAVASLSLSLGCVGGCHVNVTPGVTTERSVGTYALNVSFVGGGT
jgi:hypothetical protein